jgi:hypothetical protein
MKHKFLFLLLILLVACDNQPSKKYSSKTSPFIADSIWGSSPTKIENSENFWMFNKKYGELNFSGIMRLEQTDSLHVIINYYFQSDKLNKVQYYLEYSSKSEGAYVAIVNKMFSDFKNHYGIPESSSKRWDNKMYENDPSNLGRALMLGHVTYYSKWDSRRTKIKYTVWGDLDGKLTFSIEYLSKEYSNSFSTE